MTDNALKWHKVLQPQPLLWCENDIYIDLKAESKHIDTVGDVMIQTLYNWGINQAFGTQHSTSGLTDAALRIQEKGETNYYTVHHARTAAFAASAYGKLTGRPAACLAITESCAINLLAGLWDANADRAPVVALTGQVNTQALAPDASQETDQVGTYGKVAQWSQTVQHDSHHAELANLACKNAILNRGVSHLIFPDNIAKRLLEEPMPTGSPKGRLPSQSIAPPEDALRDAIGLLRASERPVIVVGYGARDRMEAVIQLAEQLRAPVVTTFKGKGLIPDNHPLAGGVLDRSGTPVASWLMNKSDTLLVFGASFSSHTGITDKRPTVQVDYDLTALAKFHTIDVPVWGEIGVTAQALSDDFLGDMWTQDQTSDVAARWAIWREEKKRHTLDKSDKGINPASLFEALSDIVNDDAIISIDVGNDTNSFGRYFECRKQAILMPGDPRSIGFAFPAAMGAWSATQEDEPRFKDRQVLSISGDSDVAEHLTEIHTAVKYDMNITHIIMNSCELVNYTSFADYACQCGAMGLRVAKVSELETALVEALNYPGPALIEVIIDAKPI